MERKNIVGRNIRDRRTELGMTQSDLAKKMGYADKSAISRIETGKNDINQRTVERFAEALMTTPARIMGWDKISDKVTSVYPSGKAVLADNMQDTEVGNEIIKSNIFAEIDKYMDGDLPTFKELDYVKAIRRLDEYKRRIVDMLLFEDTNK